LYTLIKGMQIFGIPGVVIVCFLLTIQLSTYDLAAQVQDSISGSIFDPEITFPAYPNKNGPTVFLDEGHHNRHTYGGLGGFISFSNVIRKDGYQVTSFKDQFSRANLQNVRILVISCAQNEQNLWPRWFNPTYPAFQESEERAIKKWVKKGGSLFLITDHHPFPGAVGELAEEFGFSLYNGHALDTTRYPSFFHRANKTLHCNAITNGRNSMEIVDSIVTFSGSALRLSDEAKPIITFDNGWVQWLPDTAWNLDHTEPLSISGLAQGAYREFGQGKIVIFSDANTFSAQDTDWGGKMGFLDPNAKYNPQLLLNIVHYLDGLLDKF
jgi:hypothetical protein